MKSCLEENSMTCTETQLNDLTELLYQDFSVTTGLGIDFETFQRYIQENKDILKNLKASASKWLNGPERQQRRSKPPSVFRYCFSYLRNHLSCIVFIVFYIVLNAGLFAEAAYRNYSAPPNVWIIIAKGCGRSLNFNSAFIVVLMLRKCLTWLRPTRLGHALPLDQHIDLHKMVGWVVVSLSVIHTTAHLMNLGFQWSGNLPFVTGVILVSVLVVMVVCSLPFVRRKGYFQLFYWTHQLFFIWWICLLVHATTFWIWVLFPAMLYAMERVHRTKWMRKPHNGRTYIERGAILPSKVVHLKVRRPAHFTFKAGDYVYVNIPSIAKHEWHPFTISSAPEQKDYLELHVRVVGTWTRKLYGYYKRCGELSKEDSPSVAFLEEAVKSIPDLLEDLDLIDVEIEELDREQAVTNMPNIVLVGNEQATVHNKGVNTDSAPNDSRRNLSNQACVGDADPPLSHEVTAIIPDGASPERASTIPTISESIHYNLQNVGVDIEINFDGPYGSPSERIFESEHAVLVGAGIGVTPFASILQSIHERYKAAKRTCPECKYAWKEEIPESELKLRKVEFIWINRDQKSFEWFVDLIGRLEKDLQEHGPFDNFLNFHLYMTSAIHIQQCAGFGLELALDLLHRRDRRDLLTGLQSRTKSGRPDWDKVLGKICQEKKGEITIFYCGPRQLGQQLKRKSYQFGMKFRQEIF
ncbi:NADPH oxidase 5-like [Ptychodera flava]|uniref:NADPH oxidase 5-like n=1 Tax=Ptychodera flava TaxID=63121 RepID=UPI00396A5ECC